MNVHPCSQPGCILIGGPTQVVNEVLFKYGNADFSNVGLAIQTKGFHTADPRTPSESFLNLKECDT